MTKSQRSITATAALALVGAYSWIMMGTSGSAASWAWLILAAAIAFLAAGSRDGDEARSGGRAVPRTEERPLRSIQSHMQPAGGTHAGMSRF